MTAATRPEVLKVESPAAQPASEPTAVVATVVDVAGAAVGTGAGSDESHAAMVTTSATVMMTNRIRARLPTCRHSPSHPPPAVGQGTGV